MRAQRHSWVAKNRVPTIGAVCRKACALAQVAVELSLCRANVCEGSYISSDVLLLLQHRFPLGATPRSANGMGNSRGFKHQASSPHLGRGANLRKLNEQMNEYKFWTEPRPCMVLGPKPLGKPTTQKKSTSFGQNQDLVWSSDPSLWGNQLLKRKVQVLDRTKALYGPRTQASGETTYLRGKCKVWTQPGRYMALRI